MIVYRNRDYMFTVFLQGDRYLMTVVASGVAQYEITITVPAQDVESFQQDENKAIALSKDVATRTSAYADRIVQPSIDPS